MKKPFAIYQGNTALTAPITDDARLSLGYSIMYSMAEDGASFKVNGKEIEIDKEQLVCKNEDGESFKPALDKEWYGTEKEQEQFKERALDIIMEEMRQDGGEPDRDFERDIMDKYGIASYDEDRISVRFAPFSCDFEKAGEIYQFARYGMNRSVDFAYDRHSRFDNGKVPVNLDSICQISRDGDVLEEPDDDNEWTKGAMNEDLKNRILHPESVTAVPRLDESLLKEPENSGMENGMEM